MTDHEIDRVATAVAEKIKDNHPSCLWGMSPAQAAAMKTMANAANGAAKVAGATAVVTLIGIFITIFIIGFKAKIMSWL